MSDSHYPTKTALENRPVPPPLLSIPGEPADQPDVSPAIHRTNHEDQTAVPLGPRILEILTAAPIVLGKHGVAWFNISPDGIEISAAGDAMAFTHRSNAMVPGSSIRTNIAFGVPAGQLASIARWSLKQKPSVGLDLAVRCRTGDVVVTPNRTLLTDGRPVDACLVGVPGSLFETDEDSEFSFDDRLERWPLTGYFEAPPNIAAQEEREDLGQLDSVSLGHALTAVRDLIPNGKRPELEILELRDGTLYGGGLDAAFWCSIPSLAGVDLSFAREQLHPLLRLLWMLPSRTCRLARDRNFHILSNSRSTIYSNSCTTIYVKAPDLRHPADVSFLLATQPEAGISVDAGMLRRNLDALRRGRGTDCPDAFLHATLTASHPRLKMESRRPSSGQQNVKARDLPCRADAPGLEFDLLTPLAGVEKALARCEGHVSLRAGKKHFYVSAPVLGAPDVVRMVRLPAVSALSPDRLASQVRQLAGPAVSSPDRKRRAAP